VSTLSAADFPAYFRAIHGYESFPWQSRLATQVLDEGRFPDVLAIPTGCGKTSTLDVALFALAVRPDIFPRRVLMVIDRRVVVDQGADHARKIRKALIETSDPIARLVARRVRELWGGGDHEKPFAIAVLRGGMPRDDAWAHRPDRPVLGISTVDQVGSRLLFRGYGPSEMMASVHAGLLGHDTLFLLDEVHLSVPFAETLLALRDRWRKFYPSGLPDRWGVVQLSATPGMMPASDPPFKLEPGGEDDEHPVLRPRLFARKLANLQQVKVAGNDEDHKRDVFSEAVAEAAKRVLVGDSRTIGVIVNRVATARIVSVLIQDKIKEAQVYLLTGRMRPLDRDAVLEELQPRIKAGRARNEAASPLFVVATQCIEAGADFDFDALVTECASLDALKQRFGRLDRLGTRCESRAVILARSDQTSASGKPDPIYGTALRATWEWLQTFPSAPDFGIRHLPEISDAMLGTLTAPRERAPILLPAHLDAWSQTHPRPWPDPEVPLWLHGPQRGEPDVQIVWRADCTEELLESKNGAERIKELLATCPPTTAEALSVPISAARRWLQQISPDELADVPMKSVDDGERSTAKLRAAFWWRGEDSQIVKDHDGLYPGMTLVVPVRYGGLSQHNWAAEPGWEGSEAIIDHGDLAQWLRYGRAVLRLRIETLPEVIRAASARITLPQRNMENEDQDVRSDVTAWLAAIHAMELPAPWDAILAALGRKPRIVEGFDGTLTLVAPRTRKQLDATSTEDDSASFTEQAISLNLHSQQVWHWARHFCEKLGVSKTIHQDVVLAAWLHDAGKADPRFQKWLGGGSEVRMFEDAMAKSAQTQRNPQAIRLARERAGYPAGYRHELLSVALVQAHETLLDAANDRELVLHLIGSHHGWCRPFAPFNDDEENLSVKFVLDSGPEQRHVTLEAGTRHCLGRLGSGIADRFGVLNERYGWWGLAWLEAILRLADHRASAEGFGENDGLR
jgi:CRISPR-associated endonuclease/helicase Cas3